MKRIARVAVTIAATAALGVLGSAGSASAGTPVVQGCVGSTFADGARAVRPLGEFVLTFAQDPTTRPGLGDGIQALQAGDVPDDVVVNTCHP